MADFGLPDYPDENESDAPLPPSNLAEIIDAFNSGGPISRERLEFIENLPTLREADLLNFDARDESCPICIVPFLSILAEEEMAIAMDSPAVPSQQRGVTRLETTCGHVFCRKDITTWMGRHNTCPICRTPFGFPGAQSPEERDYSLVDVRQELANLNDEVASLDGLYDDTLQRVTELRARLARESGTNPSHNQGGNTQPSQEENVDEQRGEAPVAPTATPADSVSQSINDETVINTLMSQTEALEEIGRILSSSQTGPLRSAIDAIARITARHNAHTNAAGQTASDDTDEFAGLYS